VVLITYGVEQDDEPEEADVITQHDVDQVEEAEKNVVVVKRPTSLREN
jgi:hypothetical protein